PAIHFRSTPIELSRASGNRVEPMDRILIHESRRIPYRLHLGKRRGLRIAVTPELIVNVFAPSRAPRSWVDNAIRERAQWIVRTLDKVASCEILCFPDRFQDGSMVRYLGSEVRLAIVEGASAPPELLFDTLVVSVPAAGQKAANNGVAHRANDVAADRIVRRWHRSVAEARFRESIDRCIAIAARHNVTEPEVTIRDMRSRWGSCSSTGRVTLNLKLVMLPETLIDYVVMHELCHLVLHDHSKRYYALLTRCMPDWRERKKRLDRYRMK
ncbi:MAG TPA: SprT family zinc-dependent metalloprotease, partial [Rhodothermales bacterium]|nr:SprT family zinc-dependent metalloprotease [Rhodothermales bacterium]